MGVDRPLTFGPAEMGHLEEVVLSGEVRPRARRLRVRQRLPAGLPRRLGAPPSPVARTIKFVAACGNGTADVFAPGSSGSAAKSCRSNCGLDHTFPCYSPNREDMEMLHEVADLVRGSGADLGLGFDGDGDRCGVVDETGAEISVEKIWVMLARDLTSVHPSPRFMVDVKSTGMFAADPELTRLDAATV